MVSTFQPQEPTPRVALASAVALMVHYFNIREVDAWTEALLLAGRYSPDWVRLAAVEALYQGRYKVISVQQILEIWRRRGKVVCHFNREFEAIVNVPLPHAVQAQLRAFAQAQQAAYIQARQNPIVSDIPQDNPWTEADSGDISPVQMAADPEPLTDLLTETIVEVGDPSSLESIHLDSEPLADSRLELLSDEPSSTPLPRETWQTEWPATKSEPARLSEPLTTEVKLYPHAETASPETTSPETIVSSPPAITRDPLLSSGMPLKPLFSLQRHPTQIDRFCPTPDPSGFDRKLLALANQG